MLREKGGDSSDSLLVQMKVSGPVCTGISLGPQDKSRHSVTMVKGAMRVPRQTQAIYWCPAGNGFTN